MEHLARHALDRWWAEGTVSDLHVEIVQQISRGDQVSFDRLVAAGEVRSRAELVSRAIAHVERQHRAVRDLGVIRAQPYDEFDDLHERATAQRPDVDA